MNSKSLLSLLMFFVAVHLAFGQETTKKFSQTFGSVSLYEVNLKNFEADKDAEALVIYDIGKSKFYYTDNGYKIIFERKKKIKIFTTAGIKYATIEIPFYGEGDIYEKVDNIAGFTYSSENGSLNKTPLNLKTVYEEKINEAWKQKKIAMPDVKEGSVIEITYTIETPYKFNLQDWKFQSTIPTLYSEYEVHMVPFYTYTYLLQGANKFTQQSSYEDRGLSTQVGPITYNDMIHKYIMTNVPAFKDEGFITSIEDYIIKIDFQMSDYTDIYGIKTEIISTWPKMCDELLDNEDFGRYIKKSSGASEKIFNYDEISTLNTAEKLKTIVSFVKSNYSWNERSTLFASKSAKKFVNEKVGTSSDLNLFLCGMLKNAEISVTPVILSTRDHGKIKYDYPFLHFFNYAVVLVQIDSTNLLVDATDPFCPYNLLPERCLNDRGLVVSKKSNSWVNLSQGAVSSVKKTFKINYSGKGDSLDVVYNESCSNYDALELRNKYEGKYTNIENYITQKEFTIIDSVKIENYLKVDESINLSCIVKSEIERINDKIYISPFLEEPISVNPFKQAFRNYPIDMEYKKTRQFFSEIEIPEGYKVEHLPVNQVTNGKLVQYDYKIVQLSTNRLSISGYYSFSEAIFNAEDYSKLKFYFNDIMKIFNEKIVLVKNETVK
jgi:hypothetical protein